MEPRRAGGLASSAMQEILDAIQAGASGDDIAALAIPESYRAAFVRREDIGMFEGVESGDKDPRQSLHVDDVATPELAPDEAYVAVMASSINFNTVWTSIFEPLPDLRLPRPPGQGERLGRPPRPAVPRGRLRRLGRRAADGLGGAQLEAGRPGHGPLQPRRRPGPQSPTTTRCSAPTSASGASRPTSAAWPTSPWSRPTSSCPSPPTSPGRRRRSTPCATPPATG